MIPFDALRKVRLCGFLVKGFCLLCVLVGTSVSAEEDKGYGPFVIQQALLWLEDYIYADQLQRFWPPERTLSAEEALEKLKYQAFVEQAQRLLYHAYRIGYLVEEKRLLIEDRGLVQFRSAGDPLFNLEPGQPARSAVTGDAIDAPVIFNLGVISNPDSFTYANALSLWIHELGHKVKPLVPGLSQTEIDEFATRIGRRFGAAAKLIEFGSRRVWMLSPSPRLTEGGSSRTYLTTWRVPLGFALVEGGRFVDLTPELGRALDDGGPTWEDRGQGQNYFERERKVISAQALGGGRLLLELRTSRMPKDLSRYLSTDIGGGYYRSAVIEIGEDRKVKVESYRAQTEPRELIADAEGELSDLRVENGTVTGWIRFHLHNQTHFHAIGHPTAEFNLLGLLDGRPVNLRAKLQIRMNADTGGMPGEVFRREIVTEGRFTVALDGFSGSTLELTGAESRFFTYGMFGYDLNEIKRFRLRKPETLNLDCDSRLKTQGR